MRSFVPRTGDFKDGRVWTLRRSRTYSWRATGSGIKGCLPMRLSRGLRDPRDSRLANKNRCYRLSWYESDRNFQRVPAAVNGDRLPHAREPGGCRGCGPGNILAMAAIE